MDFVNTIKKVLTSPADFFQPIKKEQGYAKPWWYYIRIAAVYFIIYLLFSGVPKVGESTALTGIFLFVIYVIMLIVFLLVFGVGIFISTAILHLLLLIVGAKKGYQQTFKLLCYSSTPLIFLGPFGLLERVPSVGGISFFFVSLLIGVYIMVLEVNAAMVLHELSLGRAIIGVVVLPIALTILFAVIILIVFVGFFVALKGAGGVTGMIIQSLS